MRVKKGCSEPRLAGPQSERAIMGSENLSIVELWSRSRAKTGQEQNSAVFGEGQRLLLSSEYIQAGWMSGSTGW